MTGTQILTLLAVIQALVDSGKATYDAIQGALTKVGATPEDFATAKATLREISERRHKEQG
jgi:hypothetical protein